MSAEYVWEDLYKAAMVEIDDAKLPNRIQTAKAAIDNRLHDLQMDHGGTPEERQAICDALAGLSILRREIEGLFRKTFEQVMRRFVTTLPIVPVTIAYAAAS
jgi:hypothetical protein